MGIGAIIGGVASLGGSLMNSSAQSAASQQQAAADQNALNLQQSMFNTTQQNLSPFIQYGQGQMSNLQNQMGSLTAAFNPTMAQVAATPGYQFNLQQGLESTQNSYAAQGLGSSGAAMKGAASYASGLAANTYQQDFNNYWSNNQNAFNMMNSGATLGANAASGLATAATQNANSMSNTLTNQGSALAQGTLGSASALSGGLSGIGNSIMQYNMMQGMGGGSTLGNSLSNLMGGGSYSPSQAAAYGLSNGLDSSDISGLGQGGY